MGGVSVNRPADAQPVADLNAFVEAERSGRPFLLFRDRDDRQQLFFLEPASVSVPVGRLPSSGLRLDWDSQVSRLHARFERVDDAWALVDDGLSSNGTFVNEERLTGNRRLNDGDTLRFGNTTVTFHSPKPEQLGPASAALAPAPGGGAASAPPSPLHLSSTQRRVLVALCRPYKGRSGFANPATDERIAEELFLSVGEVRAHLKVLSVKLGLEKPPEAETRVGLVERAFSSGLISERDL
jgi:FHA domain